MKIKNISMQGFKSFVDRVQFSFPPGTSAIVGPNGCGKSNIVDAVRWVLGEHNARHLRGKTMEDLIFNGSDTRKSLGMAEVTLTLSNEGGLAPARFAGFPEIEVQRRLYRSGESEYAINKVPCRLKDIVELFTDTGVGTNAYSIIEQGQVGWLVSAKPEERRVLFEEAAGINKFKQKREASLRRLEATKENLTRVSDIIGEVKRQLNSLNRQAKKAERYKLFKDELKGLDLYLASRDFKRLTTGRVEAEKAMTELKDREVGFISKIDNLSARIDEARVDQIKGEEEYALVREEAEQIERLIRSGERESEILSLKMEELRRGEERITEEISALKTRGEELTADMRELNGSRSEIAAALESVGIRLEEYESALTTHNDHIRATSEEFRRAETAAIEGGARLSDIKHSIHLCVREEETLREQEARAISEREDILGTLKAKSGPLEDLRGSIDEFSGRKEEIEKSIIEEDGRLTELLTVREEGELALKQFKEDWAKATSRLNTFEEMVGNMEGLEEGVRSIVRSGLDGSGSALSIIADIVEPEAGYEKAVEAVLGERLNCVIVESQSEGLRAIEQLKGSEKGRGSFLPAREMRSRATSIDRSYIEGLGPGVAEELKDKVGVKEGYEGVIDNLLSGALVVSDLSVARELWQGNGAEALFVTPAGEMIDHEGVLTGGSADSAGSTDGILEKRREIIELKASVSDLDKKISIAVSGQLDLDGEILKLRAGLDEHKRRLYAEDLGRINKSSELKVHEDDATRLSERVTTIAQDLNSITDKLKAVALKKSELAREREALGRTTTEAEDKAASLELRKIALSEEKDVMAARVTETKVEFASLSEKCEAFVKLLEEKERMSSEAAEGLASRTEEVERGRGESVAMSEKLEVVKHELDSSLKNKDEIRERVREKQEIASSFTEKIKAMEGELSKEKRELGSLQEDRGNNSIALRELELELDNLRERMIEKYGVAIEAHSGEDAGAEGGEGVDAEMSPQEIESRADELREKIGKLGEVSLAALEEYKEQEERYNFLIEQKTDLESSVESLHSAISRINRTTRERFKKAFDEINEKFRETFPKFFNGGRAELKLSDETNLLETGVEIVAQPPGKKLQNIMLLSGGEKALTATALIFAIFFVKPSPFCFLDEVDAPLDDANVERFNGFVKEMSDKSQFILITHNKRTMEVADTLFGITMEEPGVSRGVAVEF